MTPEEFLAIAFEAWKSGKETDLDKAIGIALSNGIGLVIKIPKSVLDETAEKKPITRQDAIEFSTGTEGDLILFDIPSDKKLGLAVLDDFRHKEPPCLLIKSEKGIFGSFFPNQVAFLGPQKTSQAVV